MNLATPKVERIDPDDERLFLPRQPTVAAAAAAVDSPALTVIKRCIEDNQDHRDPESKQLSAAGGHLPMNLSVRKSPLLLHQSAVAAAAAAAAAASGGGPPPSVSPRFGSPVELGPEEIAKARALYQVTN